MQRWLILPLVLAIVALTWRLAYAYGYRRGQAAHFKRLAAVGSRFADPDWMPNA